MDTYAYILRFWEKGREGMASRFIILISQGSFIFAWLLTICFIENGAGNGRMDLGVVASRCALTSCRMGGC
jgi:hypothetical protein